MSYELCLMSYLMSYVILSSYDLTALVYVLLLGLRLTISRLVSMHFVLCRFLRILEDMWFSFFTNSYSTWGTSTPNGGFSQNVTSYKPKPNVICSHGFGLIYVLLLGLGLAFRGIFLFGYFKTLQEIHWKEKERQLHLTTRCTLQRHINLYHTKRHRPKIN